MKKYELGVIVVELLAGQFLSKLLPDRKGVMLPVLGTKAVRSSHSALEDLLCSRPRLWRLYHGRIRRARPGWVNSKPILSLSAVTHW